MDIKPDMAAKRAGWGVDDAPMWAAGKSVPT